MTPEVKERIEQIRNGNVPEGHKKTGVGIIPEDWDLRALNTVMGNLDAGTSVNSDPTHDTGYYILKTSAVHRGCVDLNEAKPVIEADIGRLRCPVQKGRIMISRMNTPALVGECGYITKSSDVHFLPDRLWQAENISPDTCEFLWLNSLLNSERYRAAIHSMATGTSNSMKNISKENFLGLTLAMPTLDEQQKIAEILSAQDKIVRVKEKLLAEKQQQKKYLMQQLLTGKKRLPGFDGEWMYVRANQIFKNVTDKKHDGTLEVLSATQDRGIIPRSQVDIDIKYAEESLSGYKKVAKGNFVISLRSFQGGIEYSEYTGIVSPAYTVLSSIYPIEDNYYKQFFKSADYINRLNIAVYGIRDGKQISYDDFGRIKIPYPPLEEQKAIAEVLTTADREIEILKKTIEQEKQKKKALMQLLLTGIVRVPTDK